MTMSNYGNLESTPNISYKPKTSRAYGRYVTESLGDYAMRLGNILNELEGISSTHIDWFTHRDGRQVSCWICEVLLLARVLAGELDVALGDGLEEQRVFSAEGGLDSNSTKSV